MDFTALNKRRAIKSIPFISRFTKRTVLANGGGFQSHVFVGSISHVRAGHVSTIN